MTKEEVRQIAAEAAKVSVRECLLTLGINTEDSEAILDFHRDMSDLRSMIATFRDVKAKGTMAIWLLVLSALAGALWVGIKTALH